MNPFAAKQEKFYCAKCGKRLEWLSEQIFFEGKFYCVNCFEIEKQKNRKIIKLIPILEFEEKTIENMLQNLLNEVKRKIKKEKHKFDMICFVKSAILELIGSRLLAISTLHKDEKVKEWLNLRYLDILTKTNHKLSELLIKEYGKKLSKKYLENELKKGQEEIEKLFKH